ncbi:MAG: N-acetylmuramoyl-L-alanine amidase-like domain-containing protein [Bacteroidota bacterium]
MKRRDFVHHLVVSGLAMDPLQAMLAAAWQNSEDVEICRHKFSLAVSLSLQSRPINEVIIQMGISFLETDYAAFALELPGPERLVVNMRGLDCVSFYENALVLARCVKKDAMTFDQYRKELTFIRYRGGVIDGYPSRLHYTSDYFFDNERKGVWKDVTKESGGVRFVKTINFMSTHPEQYRQLRENPKFLDQIRQKEAEISRREKYFLPKEKISQSVDKILSGDILGITTDIAGLDVSHTGIAVRQNGTLHLLHAPAVGKKVQVSESTLSDYLAQNKRHTGLMIVRPAEPKR